MSAEREREDMRKAEGVIVHRTAIVEQGAELGVGVTIGPYSVIGSSVRIGDYSEIASHVVVDGSTEIGAKCRFFPYSSIGSIPQDLKFVGEESVLKVGAENVFREFVTANRGTTGGGGATSIGDHNYFMAYSHVAHDCRVGSSTVFANAATLGGHVMVGDYAVIGAFSAVHPFCRVGQHAYVGGFSIITKDALPFVRTVGHRSEANAYDVNTIGLRRRQFSNEAIRELKKAFRVLRDEKTTTSQSLENLEEEFPSSDAVHSLIRFIRESERGVIL